MESLVGVVIVIIFVSIFWIVNRPRKKKEILEKEEPPSQTTEEVVEKVTCITINTDASFCPETGAAGYAFYIICNTFKINESGIFKKGFPKTPTEAEMMCIGNALSRLLEQEVLPEAKYLIVNTDSKESIKHITDGSSELGLVINKYWQAVINSVKSVNNEFRHVKAHSGVGDNRSKANEWCDTEAKKQMRAQRERIRTLTNT